MLIKSFLDYLRYERNYSEKTVLAYGEDIKQLREFAQEEYGKFDPLEVEGELIREWIVSLMDKDNLIFNIITFGYDIIKNLLCKLMLPLACSIFSTKRTGAGIRFNRSSGKLTDLPTFK